MSSRLKKKKKKKKTTELLTIKIMFTLMAMIRKQFALNRKLYVAYKDFEKAFDSIARKLLWPILLKNGFKGRLYKCVKKYV